MKNKAIWVIVSCLMVAGLLLASCAPAAPTTTPTTAPTTAPTTGKPVESEKIVAPVLAEEPKYGGTLSYIGNAVGGTLTTFDSYRPTGDSNFIQTFAFESLTILDWAIDRKVYDFPAADGGPGYLKYSRGALLESWEQPDPLTLICHVRQGVRWQNKPPVNGREFTAADAVWNIERLRQSPFQGHAEDKHIESTRVLDKYTFEIKFKYATFERLEVMDTTFWWFVPKESVGASGQIEDWKLIIGTGPFMIKDFVPGSVTTFVRNPDYWGYDELHPENRLPYVDAVKVLSITDLSTVLSALRTGKLDRTSYGLHWQDAESVLRTNPEILSRRVLQRSSTPIFRMRVDLAPFTDVRVRKAMNMAIDREGMVKTLYGGHALPKYTAIGPAVADAYTPYGGYPPDVNEVLSYNPEKAKQLLAEAGYPNGFKTHIDAAPQPAFPAGIQEVFQSSLAKIGIEAELRLHDYSSMVPILYGRKGTALMLHNLQDWGIASFTVARFADPTNMFNTGHVDDPVLAKMWEEAQGTLDYAEYHAKLREIDKYVIRQAYAVFWPQERLVTLWQPWVKGYHGESFFNMYGVGPLYARIWVDQDLKERMTGTR